MTRDNKDLWSSLLNQRTDFDKWQVLEELELDMSDDDLKWLIKNWMWIAAQSEKVLITEWAVNKQYYIWNDTRTKDILDDKSKVTDNRIFTDIETIVPIVTSSPAKPVVFIPSKEGKNKTNKEKIRKQAIQTQKLLLALYKDQDLQRKFEKMIRQSNIYRIWMMKYWIADDKIFAEAILPSRLLLDSEAVSNDDSEFIWEKIVDTAKNLANKYPDKKEEIKEEVSGKMWTKITYIEWRTDEFVVVSIWSRIILDKKKNPLFDYAWETEESYNEMWKEMEQTTKFNVFNRPKKPYIRFSIYNIWENIIDDTSCLELCKSLQDNINDRKRQIADNADKAWNPIRQYKGMTKDQADDADNNLSAWDWVNLGDDQSIDYIQASPLPAFIQNDLQDSRNSIDNIFGIHSTTRWERQAWAWESWRAREALREWDEDRQATIGRAIEEVSEELYNAFLHLIKVFYDKPQLIPVIWKDSAWDFLEAKREDVADWMKILVRPWSTVPDDPNALKAQALELLWGNLITRRRAFEMMWIEDAEEAAKELELEQVKAQKAQQEVLKEEADIESKQKTKDTFQAQIEQLGAWQIQQN